MRVDAEDILALALQIAELKQRNDDLTTQLLAARAELNTLKNPPPPGDET